jgi:hypothetical protein
MIPLSLAAGMLTAQSLGPKLPLRLATDAWPTYNGDYSGKRFSALDQINIDDLTLTTAGELLFTGDSGNLIALSHGGSGRYALGFQTGRKIRRLL